MGPSNECYLVYCYLFLRQLLIKLNLLHFMVFPFFGSLSFFCWKVYRILIYLFIYLLSLTPSGRNNPIKVSQKS